jgi:hypothetical protein
VVWLQSIVHVFCVVLHDVHSAGHVLLGVSGWASPGGLGASIEPVATQKPLLQVVFG